MIKKYAYIYTEIDNNNDSEASFCSNCDFYLVSYPNKPPLKCPKCRATLIESGDVKIIGKKYGTK